MKITENFSRKEFVCRCNCGYDAISSNLVHRLQVIRDIIKVPITIHSGCRCRKHNVTIGGSAGSLHLIGDAADWAVGVKEPQQKAHFHTMLQEMLSEWSGGFHYYPGGDFFHCDVGKRRRW